MRSKVLAALLLSLSACRDLDYPTPDGGGGKGPTLAFIRPSTPAQKFSLLEFIVISAEDPQGVAEVRLDCGAKDGNGARTQLFQWRSRPFEASVDFGPCAPYGAPGQISEIGLFVSAVDGR